MRAVSVECIFLLFPLISRESVCYALSKIPQTARVPDSHLLSVGWVTMKSACCWLVLLSFLLLVQVSPQQFFLLKKKEPSHQSGNHRCDALTSVFQDSFRDFIISCGALLAAKRLMTDMTSISLRLGTQILHYWASICRKRKFYIFRFQNVIGREIRKILSFVKLILIAWFSGNKILRSLCKIERAKRFAQKWSKRHKWYNPLRMQC